MVNWQNVSTVFLDMDGTLLDLHFDNHFWLRHVPERYSKKNGISVEHAKQRIFPRMQELRGNLKWYCTDFWAEELSLPIIELKRETSHLIQPREHTHVFLEWLRDAGKEIILFTNAHQDTVDIKMEMTGLTPAFDKIVTSHELGVAKESPGAWEAMTVHHRFDVGNALFIDDNFAVLDCARNFGIRHLFGIQKPDSAGPNLSHDEYTLLESFEQLIPT